MNGMDDRERAFEKKFEYDEEIKFKIASRSAHLLGLWAAEQLGLKDAEAESYSRKFVEFVVEKSGHDGLVEKIERDLKTKGQPVTRHRIEKELENFHQQARQQIVG